MSSKRVSSLSFNHLDVVGLESTVPYGRGAGWGIIIYFKLRTAETERQRYRQTDARAKDDERYLRVLFHVWRNLFHGRTRNFATFTFTFPGAVLGTVLPLLLLPFLPSCAQLRKRSLLSSDIDFDVWSFRSHTEHIS